MEDQKSDGKVDALTADLNDLKLTVEELQVELPAPADAASLATIQTALDQAGVASNELSGRRDDDPWVRWASQDRETAALIARARAQFGTERMNLAALEALEEADEQASSEAVSAAVIFKALLQELLTEPDDPGPPVA